MALYTHTTYMQARGLLAQRLADPSIFWTDKELGFYLIDALRHWSLLAQYNKDEASFSTVAGQAFYSLKEQIPSLRPYTVTDQDLLPLLQYHLMELPSTGSWVGTEQFNLEAILESITRCRNKLLLQTNAVLQVSSIPTGVPPVLRVSLPDTVIDLRRVAWKSPDSYKTLRQRDSISRRSFSPTASYNSATPDVYLKSSLPYVNIELSPPANDVGELQVVTVQTGLTATGSGILLGIPDDFLPTLKWGVLSDLLSADIAGDAERAAYCEARWQEGVEACRTAPVLWAPDINGAQVSVSALAELDAFQPNWQNTSGQPLSIGVAGYDLLALAPVPDDVYSVVAQVTRTAIVPTDDMDFIQIGREHLDMLLDYCVHLASFKQGGDTFGSTKPLFDSFLAAAKLNNNRLKAQAFYLDAGNQHSTREEQFRPRAQGE